VLTDTALALGAAAAATVVSQGTAAQEKLSQAGEISPSGWCQLFVKKT
jgi:hypothetical protein